MPAFLSFILRGALTVFAVISLSFFLIYLIPGGPVDFILKDRGAPEDKERLRQALSLDQPLAARYGAFLKNLLKMDLGRSLVTEEPVFEALKEQSAFTLPLAGMAFALSLLWGISFGLLSMWAERASSKRSSPRRAAASPHAREERRGGAWRGGAVARSAGARGAAAGTPWRRLFFDTFPILLFSFPAFALAPLLTDLFSLRLRWLPVSGAGGFSYLILPAVSLALPLGAILMKITRAAMDEARHLDCVRTAESKGLSPARVYCRHIFPNALIPIVTIAGLQLGALLTGTVIIETLFDRPGLGSLLYRAIVNRDYPMIQGAVLLIAVLYVLINRLTDGLYIAADPRLRKSSH